jgi:hypothetical protein
MIKRIRRFLLSLILTRPELNALRYMWIAENITTEQINLRPGRGTFEVAEYAWLQGPPEVWGPKV